MSIKPRKPSTSIINSTTKIQEFFGVDDIDQNNLYNAVAKRDSATEKLKRMFSCNTYSSKSNNSTTRNSQKLRRRLSKLKRPRLSKSKSNNKSSPPSPFYVDIDPNIAYRPSLSTIMNDDILLHALVHHMGSQYNSENILFLIAVKEFDAAPINELESRIVSIYHLYIEQYAKKQVNLSYNCLMNVMQQFEQLGSLSIVAKREIFNQAVQEISSLLSSVLSSAYQSSTFQDIARKSKQFKIFLDEQNIKTNNNFSPFSFDSMSPSSSPYSALSSPPIKIDMSSSMSPVSVFAFDA